MDLVHYRFDNFKTNGMAWYGYERDGCPEAIYRQLQEEKEYAHKRGLFSERECEVDCFLTVIETLHKEKITLLDLGTGWGEWVLALAGVVEHKLVPFAPSTYYAVGVECDKHFYDVAFENCLKNRVSGMVLYGAVGKRDGETRVNIGKISRQFCGSSLSFAGNFSDSPLYARLSGLYHFVTRQTDRVEMYCIDTLMKDYFKAPIDLVVMDIQGTETLAIEGAKKSWDRISYWLIGTHGRRVHQQVKDLLRVCYDFLVDAPPDATTMINSDYGVICQKGQDGILLCKSKSL